MSRSARNLGATFIALALTTMTGIAQTPAAQPAGPGPNTGEGARPFMSGLNLTDAQRQQIRTLREQGRTAMREQMQQLRDARLALRNETFADAPDSGRIESLQQQVATLSQQVEARRLDLQRQIAQILTPEQRQYVREHRGQMRQFRGRRMNRPGGWF